MRLSARLACSSILCAVAWTCMPAAVDARQAPGSADPAMPTPLEGAIIEYLCGALRPAGTIETPKYLQCRDQQLTSLRADFGRDLRRLTPAERAKLDTVCDGLRASRGQDAYVQCLSAQLTGLRGRGSRAKPDAAAAAPNPTPPQAPDPAPVASPPAAPPSSTVSGVFIGAALLAFAVVAGGAFVALKARRSFGACRTCGRKLEERGDLCQTCRRDAAETLRRASAERAGQARAHDEEQRRRAARELEQQQRARDEEARRQQLEQSQQEQAREQEEEARRRRREEEASERRAVGAVADPNEFDPYAVLGVPKDASAVDVETAYREAVAKLDPELVSGLGADLQEHFRKKGEAVQRAYDMLATSGSG
jgi:hypothetical protein